MFFPKSRLLQRGATMNNKELFIHVGYPKTATTTFQRFLYPRHSQLDYLRKNNANISFINDLFFARENSFSRLSGIYIHELEHLAQDSNKDKLLYSEESLTSFSMFFRSTPAPCISTIEPNSIARKLKMCFPDTNQLLTPKILITIRRQDELLKSMYAQVYNLVFKRFKQTNTFERFLDYTFEQNPTGFIADALLFNEVISNYEHLFGSENVYVSVYEELLQDKQKYVEKLCRFMGIDANEALTLISEHYANKKGSTSGYHTDDRNLIELLSHHKNKYLGHRHFGLADTGLYKWLQRIYIPGRTLPKFYIPTPHRHHIQQLYTKGNQTLSERYHLDLGRYGYYFD